MKLLNNRKIEKYYFSYFLCCLLEDRAIFLKKIKAANETEIVLIVIFFIFKKFTFILLLLHNGTITSENVLVFYQNVLYWTYHSHSNNVKKLRNVKMLQQYLSIFRYFILSWIIFQSRTPCSMRNKRVRCFEAIGQW